MNVLKTLTFSSMLCLVSCKTPKATRTDMTLLIDLTGSYHDNIPNINPHVLQQAYGLDNPKNYGDFRLDFIADVNYSKADVLHLSPVASVLEYNEFDREQDLQTFQKGMDSLIQKANDTPRGKPSSAVYMPLARSINRMAKSKADQRIIIIYSDLFENSSFFHCYEPKHLQMLEQNPQKVQALFQKQLPLEKDLTGVAIYIVYEAPNEVASMIFERFANAVYTPMLEDKGATVHVGANLIW